MSRPTGKTATLAVAVALVALTSWGTLKELDKIDSTWPSLNYGKY